MISSSRFIVNKTLSLSRRPILSSAAATTTFPVPIGRRGYRGDTGEEVQVLSESEEALLKIAVPRSQEIFRQHIELPVDDLFTRQKRLIYRAKQRGWLGKFFFFDLRRSGVSYYYLLGLSSSSLSSFLFSYHCILVLIVFSSTQQP